MEKQNKKLILDACCSVKAMWYNKKHPNAVYIDIRREPSGFLGYGRKEELNPDFIMDNDRIPLMNGQCMDGQSISGVE